MNQSRPLDCRTTISRRKLLRGVGGLTAALSSPVWRPATLFAATGPAVKRFIAVFSANGTIPSAFFPPGTASSAPLTLGPILAPLEKHLAKLMVIKGVHMTSTTGSNKPGGPHMKGPGAMLTGGSLLPGNFSGAGGPAGYADNISVDQIIANRVGASTRFASLELGVRVNGQPPLRVISYRGANQPNAPEVDPWAVYARLFGASGLSSTDLQRLITERKSVLDFLKDDVGRLRNRFTADDRSRLDAHLGGLRRIEQALTVNTASCKAPTLPGKVNPTDTANFPTIAKLQMDLMLLAHACDMTRVSTFMFANADSWQYYPWIGVNSEHHATSHAGDSDTAARDKLIKINTWHAEQVAYMLDGLASVPEGGGTMLDNTVLVWGNELGVGNSHTYKNIPWLLAGGAGGAFKMGRFLNYADKAHNDLLLALVNAMGIQDVKAVGYPELNTGPLAGLTP